MNKYIVFLSIFISNVLLAYDFSGRIVDNETGSPLPGASVRILNTQFGNYSNSYGYFLLKNLNKNQYEILVSMIGYKSKTLTIKKDQPDIIIKLEEKVISTNEIVVSANKRVQAVQDVPMSVSVIDSKTLNLRNTVKLDEAIRYVPGVEVNQDNISIRGSSGFSFGIGSRAALLVDGFPLIAGDNGDVEFEALPLFNIERIEVIKGAGSALYGTSALGGVINIITSEPKPIPEFKARFYTGIYTKPKYSEWDYSESLHKQIGLNTNYSQKFGSFGLNIGGSYLKDDSYQSYRDEEQFSLNAKLNYDFSDYTSLFITSNFNQKDRADWVYWESLNKATIPPEDTDESIRLESDQLSLYGNLKHIFNERNFLNFKAGILKTQFNNTYNENDTEYRQSEADNINVELQVNSEVMDDFMFTYGLNYLNNTVNSITYGDQLQQIFSAYLQGEYQGFKRTILTLGGRYDYEKADGNIDGNLQISPKMGISYKPDETSTLRFSAGSGFRAPTVAERFASVSFQGFEVIPNTELIPEKSASFEIGYSLESKIDNNLINIDFSFFDNEFFDLIEPGFVNESAKIKFDNLTRARILGAELSLKTFLYGLIGLETSITAMNPKNVNTDEILKYRSEFIWYSRITLPYKDFRINLDYRFKNKVKNIDDRLGLQINSHDARVPIHVVDAMINYDLKKYAQIPISVSLVGKNLLDYYYTEVPGNLAPTRYIGFQINYTN